MRVLILADRMFATRERPLLQRLEVALLAESIRVLVAIPDRTVAQIGPEEFGELLGYRDEGIGLGRRLRAAQLIRRLPEPGPDEQRLDIVHVFGGGAWSLGAEIARQTSAALALDVWRGGLVERAVGMHARDVPCVALFAPDQSIERRLLREGGAHLVRLANWGGYAPPNPAPILRDDRVRSLMMVGGGRDRAWFTAAFDGIARLLSEHDDLLLFADAEAFHRAGLWKRAKSSAVLDKISLIGDMESHRDLVLKGDLLIYPDPRQEHRTLLLDAMANGIAVVAARDPGVTCLIENRTALLIDQPDPGPWADAIGGLLEAPDQARELGRSARQYIRDELRAGAYSTAVLDAYEWMTSGEAIRFQPAKA